MFDDYEELKGMLSLDREDIKKMKDMYELDFSNLINRIKDFQISLVDISGDYDLENNFDKFKDDDIFIRRNMKIDALNYKISLFQNTLQEFFAEKKILDFIAKKENELNQVAYLEYIKNPLTREEYIKEWIKEFNNKKS